MISHRRTTSTWHSLRAVLVALLAVVTAATSAGVNGDEGVTWEYQPGDAELIVGLRVGATATDLDTGTVVGDLDALGLALVRSADPATLANDPDVAFVSRDRSLLPTSSDSTIARANRSAADELHATALWEAGFTGAGQTVALIDTGISEHADLAGRVVHGPNLAGDRTSEDRYGHGTVMAGLIAGDGTASQGRWTGVAPDATVLSVKVAGADGATDVSQVLAGLQWLVSCHVDHAGGACATTHDASVVVLAYTTDSTQSATIDPLAYAIQRVHAAGILVIASAGNDGDGRRGTVDGPGAAPWAYTVGAFDASTGWQATFSEYGRTVDGIQKPEALASGVNLVGPVDTRSTIARRAPHALRDGGYIRGSGTSQAAAAAGGLAALVRQAQAGADASHVRALLSASTAPVRGGAAGRLDGRLVPEQLVRSSSPWLRGDGTGTLDGARGSVRVFARIDGRTVLVDGEYTATGQTWDARAWAGSTWDGSTWDGSTWDGSTWDGSTWDGSTWDGSTWDGSTWDGSTWDGSTWDGSTWDGSTWDVADWE
ncbi:MAG TPA: S8 family serine peptidase [Nitriliruptorales bacterium]